MDIYLAYKWSLMFGLSAYLLNRCLSSVDRVGSFTGGDGDRFGWDVAIYDTQCIVSTVNVDKIYIYESNETSMDSNWNLAATLNATNVNSNAIYKDLAIAASLGSDPHLYIFKKQNGGEWYQFQLLSPKDGESSFGAWRAADFDHENGKYIIVGARLTTVDGQYAAGSAYIFTQNATSANGEWYEMQTLTASDVSSEAYFGFGVAISGNIAAVGAYGSEPNGRYSGAIYAFEYDEQSGNWTQRQKLIANDSSEWSFFGRTVSMYDENTIATASEGESSVYIFTRDIITGIWNQTYKIYVGGHGDDYTDLWGVSMYENSFIVGDTGNDIGIIYKRNDTNDTWYWYGNVGNTSYAVDMNKNRYITGNQFEDIAQVYVDFSEDYYYYSTTSDTNINSGSSTSINTIHTSTIDTDHDSTAYSMSTGAGSTDTNTFTTTTDSFASTDHQTSISGSGDAYETSTTTDSLDVGQTSATNMVVINTLCNLLIILFCLTQVCSLSWS